MATLILGSREETAVGGTTLWQLQRSYEPDLGALGQFYFTTTSVKEKQVDVDLSAPAVSRASGTADVLFRPHHRVEAGRTYALHKTQDVIRTPMPQPPQSRQRSQQPQRISRILATITSDKQRIEVPQGTTLSQLWSTHPTLCNGHSFFLYFRAQGLRGLTDGHVEVLFRPADSVMGGREYCAARMEGSQDIRLIAEDNPHRDQPAVIELPDKTTREIPAGMPLADVSRTLSDYCGPRAKLVLLPKVKGNHRVLLMPEDAVEGAMEYSAQISYMHLDPTESEAAAERKLHPESNKASKKQALTSSAAVTTIAGSQHGFLLPALSLHTALERVMSQKGEVKGGVPEGGMMSAAKEHIERQREGQAGRSTAGQPSAPPASRSNATASCDRHSGGDTAGRQGEHEAQDEEGGAAAATPSMAAAAVAGWSAMRMAVSTAVTTGFTTTPAKFESRAELGERPKTAGSAGRTSVRDAGDPRREEAESTGVGLWGMGPSHRPSTPPLYGGDRGTDPQQGQTSWSRLFG